MRSVVISCLLLLALPALAAGQNPVQWSGDTRGSIRLAKEQSLPLLFWVSGSGDRNDDEDDLEDAQDESFRDPAVVDFIQGRFVPVRVSRNSDVIAAAGELGLPTSHGLYCAAITPDGRVLASMGPGVVADPAAFAAALRAAWEAYGTDLFEKELRPLLEDFQTPKAKARRAAQTVYRLRIAAADTALIGLLERPDITPTERSRLYSALASLGTQATTAALLDRAEEKPAQTALWRAPPESLQWLLAELPGEEGVVTARQMAAYRAALSICRLGSPKAEAWWEKADAAARRAEIERLSTRAAAVMEYAASGGTR